MSKYRAEFLMCPSADADIYRSAVFGIVVGTPEIPEVIYLERVKPIPPELLAIDSPVKPTEIFRIAANCSEGGCKHFDGANCRLAQRIVDGLPATSEQIPNCAIRDNCRWWNQEGTAACLRCSQIVRDNYITTDRLTQVMDS